MVIDYYEDFEINDSTIDYDGTVGVKGQVLTREGTPAEISFNLNIVASADWDWEVSEEPTGWNYRTDQPTYTSSRSVVVNSPEVSSVSFYPDDDIYVNKEPYSVQEVQEIIDPTVLKQLLNPTLYSKLMTPKFQQQAESVQEPEQDYNEPDNDYDSSEDRY